MSTNTVCYVHKAFSSIAKFRKMKNHDKRTAGNQFHQQLGGHENLMNTVVELNDLPGIHEARELDTEVKEILDIGMTICRIWLVKIQQILRVC